MIKRYKNKVVIDTKTPEQKAWLEHLLDPLKVLKPNKTMRYCRYQGCDACIHTGGLINRKQHTENGWD